MSFDMKINLKTMASTSEIEKEINFLNYIRIVQS